MIHLLMESLGEYFFFHAAYANLSSLQQKIKNQSNLFVLSLNVDDPLTMFEVDLNQPDTMLLPRYLYIVLKNNTFGQYVFGAFTDLLAAENYAETSLEVNLSIQKVKVHFG